MENKPIRCCKCFVTIEKLKQDKNLPYLIQVVKEDGKQDHICSICLAGW